MSVFGFNRCLPSVLVSAKGLPFVSGAMTTEKTNPIKEIAAPTNNIDVIP